MATAESTVTYRDIPEYPGYRVGDDGSVWSAWRVCPKGTLVDCGAGKSRRYIGDEWSRLKSSPSVYGYRRVNLRRGTRVATKRVSRLVLEAFVGPCPPRMEACHEDGARSNNVLSNLRWDTRKGNAADRIRHGTDKRGEKSYNAKLTREAVLFIRSQPRGTPLQPLADRFGVSLWAVVHQRRRKRVRWAWLESENAGT